MGSNNSEKQQNTSPELKGIYFTRPLQYAILLAVGSGLAGIVLGCYVPDNNLQKALFTGSVGLIFGGLLTTIIKLLVDDHQRDRDMAADQARFISNVLSNLKSVYDRVERARIVIAAHQSSLTYGKEMRDLIDSRVQLKNVIRDLTGETTNIQGVIIDIKKMEEYLEGLTDDFKLIYLGVSKIQEEYEAKKERTLMSNGSIAEVVNEAWPMIAEKLHARGFICSDEEPSSTDYKKKFEEPLDSASLSLRNELRKLAGFKPGNNVEQNSSNGQTSGGEKEKGTNGVPEDTT